jgi:DNA modification methylase
MADSAQNPEVYELKNELRVILKREPTWEEVLEVAKKRGLKTFGGASIFDPVLAEISYLWFCPKGGKILDPFAGGSVRGIVANYAGYYYTGIDLREEQIEINIEQASKIFNENHPIWLPGDSNKVLESINDEFDFVFSCPPYHDLEVYSDSEDDLSNMNYQEFLIVYKSIIKKSIARLKENRFACFVISELRDETGFYKKFILDTIEAFEESGAKYYNEIILLNQYGSLPIRVARQFNSSRKIGRTHQNVLVFYKGNPGEIKNVFGEIEFNNSKLFEMD